MMDRNVITTAIVAFITFAILFTVDTQAQERHARPAFPIAAGQKMIVYPGNQFYETTDWSDNRFYSLPTGGFNKKIILNLPVGTRIRRLLGNFVDVNTEPDIYLIIEIVRLKDDGSSPIILRQMTTKGITSVNTSDYKQVISNPLDHLVQQNSTYFIRIISPTHQSAGELRVGEIKVIYEP